jgi:uncharacterized protein
MWLAHRARRGAMTVNRSSRSLPILQPDPRRAPEPSARAGRSAFHLLAKPTGAICNLDCTYCFFLSKEKLYPDGTFRMSEDMLERYVRQLMESQFSSEINVAWQGGEPTLIGLSFFEKAMQLVEKYRPRGATILHTIQTNGVLLDDAWCAFLQRHGFIVGISIDGPRALHDAYRVDKGGRPTHERVMRGLRCLQRHSVEFNVLTTVHAANAEHPLEVYRFLRDEVGARFIQLIPIVERINTTGFQEGDQVTERSVTGAQFGRFLNAIFDEWVTRDVGTVFMQMFDVALSAWVGERSPLCVFAETCGDALALEHNGDLYSCDHFVEPAHKLGNIRQHHMGDLVASEKQMAFGEHKRDSLPRYCRECPVKFACNGGCPKDRILATPDGEPGLNYLCEGYRAFFQHIDPAMRAMRDLLAQGRDPAEIMRA